jgi:hypothetical protein
MSESMCVDTFILEEVCALNKTQVSLNEVCPLRNNFHKGHWNYNGKVIMANFFEIT